MKFKEVAHLYLGCQYKWLRKLDNEYVVSTLTLADAFHLLLEEGKPILRKMSSLTYVEMKEIWKLFFNKEFPEDGIIECVEKNKFIFMLKASDGILRIAADGNFLCLPSSGEYRSIFNQYDLTKYLLDIHIDLFKLIDNNEAWELSN